MNSRPELPDILRGRLLFGSAEQIEALKEYEKEIEIYESGGIYEVERRYVLVEKVEITAANEEDAEEIADDLYVGGSMVRREVGWKLVDDSVDYEVVKIIKKPKEVKRDDWGKI